MTLEERVAGLERSRRRWMGTALALFLAVGCAAMLAAADRPEAQDLTVRSLTVENADGKTTARIAGSGVSIYGDSRKDGPMISLHAIEKKRGGGSQLFMRNSRGAPGINIVAQQRGNVHALPE